MNILYIRKKGNRFYVNQGVHSESDPECVAYVEEAEYLKERHRANDLAVELCQLKKKMEPVPAPEPTPVPEPTPAPAPIEWERKLEELQRKLVKWGNVASVLTKKMENYRSTLFRLNGTSPGEASKVAEKDRQDIERMLEE